MNNIYFIGMCISLVVFVGISWIVSKRIKSADDFYVAGRKAPLLLICGSMIASYTSTGMFMGDAAEAFEGALSPMLIFAGMQSAGYILGAVFFGRYLRRSRAMTIPEFFGKRFCSNKMRILAAVTAIIMMTVYLLSVVQGVGTLMTLVTGVDYRICIIIALIAFTLITVVSGSQGVLITDTLMAAVFTLSMLVSVVFIANAVGGWFPAIDALASDIETKELLSWAGKPGALYDNGTENLIWGFSYGIVWLSVCAVGPWQSSRYLMAKDEHTVIRSAPIAACGVFVLEFFVCMAAVLLNKLNPAVESSSHIWIWAAMKVIPTALGVVLMTGVLSAGISSATTFLSLIGASVANDIVFTADGKKSIHYGRIAMVIVSMIVLVCAIANPPAIFVIMFLGGATAASSWMPVAFGSVFSKRLTKTGAFLGMLFGMIGCLVANLVQSFANIKFPAYLDPAIIGIVCNIAAMFIGSVFTKVTEEEKAQRQALFVIPKSEFDVGEVKKTTGILKWCGIGAGIIMALLMLVFWAIPYTMSCH